MAESYPESNSKPHIPYLFYDVIGRMMPGAYLITGAILCWLPFFHWEKVASFLKDIGAMGMSGGLAAALVATGLLFLAFVSSFLGFLLGSLSNVIVEQGLWHWAPLSRSGLVEFLGIESVRSLNERFKIQFGSDPSQDSLNRSSFLCAYYIWRSDFNLGEMQGRLDAELLAAQSSVLVSGALLAIVLLEVFFWGLSTYFSVWLAVLIVISLASGMAFKYHRKKRVYSRFALFLAVTDPPPTEGAARPPA